MHSLCVGIVVVSYTIHSRFMWYLKPYFSRLHHWNWSNTIKVILKYMGSIPQRQAREKRNKTRNVCYFLRNTVHQKIILTSNDWFQCTPCASASNYHQTSQYNRISSFTLLHTVHLDENTHIMSFHSWQVTVEVSCLFYFCYVSK